MKGNAIILLYVAAIWLWIGSTPQPAASQSSQLITQVVPDSDENLAVGVDPEAKRIVGPNGLCVDVTYKKYHDGNPIKLWRCKPNGYANQLWKLESDGTIQSNGKCLTSYGYRPGSYVMIYNCKTAVAEATRWQIWENGTIVNPKSGLVLTATPMTIGSTLTVETNIYSTSQAWNFSYSWEPSLAYISGFGLCLQTAGKNVRLAACDGSAYQKWYLYADGSIRSYSNQTRCLSCGNGGEGTAVNVVPCDQTGSSSQRWYFENDDRIWNLQYGMVLDIADYNADGKIVIWYFNGGENQIWSVSKIQP